jgi:hypothetical protein
MVVAQGAVVIAVNDMWRGKQPVSSASKPDAVPFPLLHAMTQFKELAALLLVVGLALTLVGFAFAWWLLALAQPI